MNIKPTYSILPSIKPTLTHLIHRKPRRRKYPGINKIRINQFQYVHLFQRSHWGLDATERQRRSISNQRDWIWLISLFTAKESSESMLTTAAEVEVECSGRLRPSRQRSNSFFALWCSFESVPPPAAFMVTTSTVVVDFECFSDEDKGLVTTRFGVTTTLSSVKPFPSISLGTTLSSFLFPAVCNHFNLQCWIL